VFDISRAIDIASTGITDRARVVGNGFSTESIDDSQMRPRLGIGRVIDVRVPRGWLHWEVDIDIILILDRAY
jgi:hypothetical protein